ncbi:MAG TPA: class II aldolase/adducin family protein [Phycisphaerae bacterium]|jgi:L-fuculose-phosphate aldolase|nr:class II aldolase/adducin family protein [Phycisphaerae bacterium]HOB73909.1 class II aldolase/adducin family protein [Phycisphaerae bacterium]HOJ56293.1 class II aldolase/adducin family protein [Phycisphaerae bacterium]HOL28115.1 class II aldolase/adducin family protein [Phycisphaerae bacterium]HPP19774.1 class II aldolase/adducin family protein [Phycisphaerae bacterium]
MINEFKIKQEICEIGHRIYAKGFAAANDGNISYRISDNEVLCTPTQMSKGLLKPDDICKVDMTGRQIAGRRKRTSEVLLHLEIYKLDPSLKAVVHCHPPHATAFAVAGEPIPTCILPEVEVFLGPIPQTTYETPGGEAFAQTIKPHVKSAKVVVLRNHGTVSWGDTLEHAYWWTEILDAYCRILLLAKQIGRVDRIAVPKVEELLDLKEKFGMGVDPRRLESADMCVNTEFGRGFADSSCGCGKSDGAAASGEAPALSEEEIERIVQEITDRIMAAGSK